MSILEINVVINIKSIVYEPYIKCVLLFKIKIGNLIKQKLKWNKIP